MIIDADKNYPDNNIYVTFNYRYPPHRSKVKELLMEGAIGDIRSVDFHWNINHGHQRAYMQRWQDRKSTRLNSSHVAISYAVFCLKKKNKQYYPKKMQENTEVAPLQG